MRSVTAFWQLVKDRGCSWPSNVLVSSLMAEGWKVWRDKSLTTQVEDVLASVVVAKDSDGPCAMLWAGAERPDCSVVASPTGSIGCWGPAEVPWASVC